MHRDRTLNIKDRMYRIVITALCLILIGACNSTAQHRSSDEPLQKLQPYTFEKVDRAEELWRQQLTEEEYYILREKGTERAFTGELLKNKRKGSYVCAACSLPLFHSSSKFESGTGWPSFYIPLYSNTVLEEEDRSFGMVRTEVMCNRCGGHLGHVFTDGPPPTGLRYCINSVALKFDADETN